MLRSDRFFLPTGYQINPSPRYENDVQDGGVIWQPDVYADTLRRINEGGRRRRIIDVGCGRAGKLVELKDVDTLGIDYGPNVEYLRATYPDREWVAANLERELPTVPGMAGSTVIVADVIEHLVDPTALLLGLRRGWLGVVREVVLSTPARSLHYGGTHLGPPKNRCHVREWDPEELGDLLVWFGFEGFVVSLTRSCSASPDRKTIQVVIPRQS